MAFSYYRVRKEWQGCGIAVADSIT